MLVTIVQRDINNQNYWYQFIYRFGVKLQEVIKNKDDGMKDCIYRVLKSVSEYCKVQKFTSNLNTEGYYRIRDYYEIGIQDDEYVCEKHLMNLRQLLQLAVNHITIKENCMEKQIELLPVIIQLINDLTYMIDYMIRNGLTYEKRQEAAYQEISGSLNSFNGDKRRSTSQEKENKEVKNSYNELDNYFSDKIDEKGVLHAESFKNYKFDDSVKFAIVLRVLFIWSWDNKGKKLSEVFLHLNLNLEIFIQHYLVSMDKVQYKRISDKTMGLLLKGLEVNFSSSVFEEYMEIVQTYSYDHRNTEYKCGMKPIIEILYSLRKEYINTEDRSSSSVVEDVARKSFITSVRQFCVNVKFCLPYGKWDMNEFVEHRYQTHIDDVINSCYPLFNNERLRETDSCISSAQNHPEHWLHVFHAFKQYIVDNKKLIESGDNFNNIYVSLDNIIRLTKRVIDRRPSPSSITINPSQTKIKVPKDWFPQENEKPETLNRVAEILTKLYKWAITFNRLDDGVRMNGKRILQTAIVKYVQFFNTHHDHFIQLNITNINPFKCMHDNVDISIKELDKYCDFLDRNIYRTFPAEEYSAQISDAVRMLRGIMVNSKGGIKSVPVEKEKDKTIVNKKEQPFPVDKYSFAETMLHLYNLRLWCNGPTKPYGRHPINLMTAIDNFYVYLHNEYSEYSYENQKIGDINYGPYTIKKMEKMLNVFHETIYKIKNNGSVHDIRYRVDEIYRIMLTRRSKIKKSAPKKKHKK